MSTTAVSAVSHPAQVWGEAYGEALDGSIDSASMFWTAVEQQHPLDAYNHSTFTEMATTTLPSAQSNPYFYVGIYAAIALSTILVNAIGVAVQYTGALRASKILFDRLLRAVVRATMRWHDTTPQGRMLNRFSKVRAVHPVLVVRLLICAFFKDIETIDISLAGSLQSVNRSLALLAISALTIVYVFTPLLVSVQQ